MPANPAPTPESDAPDQSAPPAADDFDWAEALRFKGWPKFPEQNADGIDLSLIRGSLALTPTQRARRADAFMKDVEYLRAVARRVA